MPWRTPLPILGMVALPPICPNARAKWSLRESSRATDCRTCIFMSAVLAVYLTPWRLRQNLNRNSPAPWPPIRRMAHLRSPLTTANIPLSRPA
jgi:hypothetical protein